MIWAETGRREIRTKIAQLRPKKHRINIANEMLDSVRDDPNLLQRVITSDEAWIYGYDVETKAQSSQWKLPHEPRPIKVRQVRSNVKVLLTVFFDCRGVVHHEFLPQDRTVNKEYYLQNNGNSPQLETTEYLAKIKPPTYDGQTSWKCFKTQFEVLTLDNCWSSSEKAINLAASLRGSATEVLQSLPLEQLLSYDETLQELAADVERLARLAFPDFPRHVQDLLAHQNFVDAIECQQSVRMSEAKTLQEAFIHALNFEAARDATRGYQKVVRLMKTDESKKDGDIKEAIFQLQRTVEEMKKTQRMESISRWIPVSNELVLQTATEEQAKVYGKVVLKFQIGNNLFSHLGYLADIKDDCLIGLDVLRKFGFSIDFLENVLKVAGEEIPLWFSTLDPKIGYSQVRIQPEDREKTAFTAENGLWQFKVMPFGLCNAPATFERLMETVLQGIPLETCLVYLDGIIVIGKSFEEHLINLARVLQNIRGARLKLNPRKYKLFK
ncbi:K02A2.6-like [Cordylochernes scorpioides]|uniref:K02A2.6-like n=1 Tax=Cordylochernes scorpioides TaxID=51811 RepID=A0ABY6KA01_9ARAC|nr:K02A2.6-like [Cordylochernes scorpioides]